MKCPSCGVEFSAASAPRWAARVRLYRSDSDDPVADSNPDLPPGEVGEDLYQTLPAVAEFLRDVAMEFHSGSKLEGLEMERLRHKLNTFRTTLARREGSGVWRVAYSVDAASWMARVDIARL